MAGLAVATENHSVIKFRLNELQDSADISEFLKGLLASWLEIKESIVYGVRLRHIITPKIDGPNLRSKKMVGYAQDYPNSILPYT